MSWHFLKNNLWKFLWLRSEKFLVFFILINLLLSGVAGFYTPLLIEDFYQSINSDESFKIAAFYLVLLLVAEYVNRFLFQISTHRYIQLLLGEIRIQSYGVWLNAPFKKNLKNKKDFPMGEVLARLMNDTDAVRDVVGSGSFAIFIDIIFVSSCLVSFLQMNSATGLTLFITEVLACLLLVKGSKFMAKIFMDVRRLTGQMARVVTDLTSGLKELYFSPNHQYASKRGEKIFEEFLDKQLHANIWDAGYYSAAESLYPILIALIMLMVPYSKIVEVAILAALIDLVQKSISPIKDIASKISVLQRAGTGLERISEFNLSFDQEISGRVDFSELDGDSLKFNLTKFRYDEGFQLSDINFHLKKGEVLGILGESGCGKSTLLKLLSGQYDTFEGKIHLDDKTFHPETDQELKIFSSYVSLISQDSHVFTETLRFNICLGFEDSIDEFWMLAEKYIPYLKNWGMTPETKLNPKMLSMGQKQLISGLRALYLKKPIILMDEISSGLDSDLEIALRDLIKFFSSRTMTVIVTHRLETILNSDRLLLLDKGCVIASGHPTVLRDNQKYRDFISLL